MSTATTSPSSLLSPTNLHILLVLAEGDRHGYGIKQEIERQTEGRLHLGPGTLYEAVHRMLDAGWIERPDESQSTPGRRKVYRITARGQALLEEELARLAAIVGHAEARGLLPT